MQEKQKLTRELWKFLARTQRLLDIPMTVLGLIWLVIIIVELTEGLRSGSCALILSI